MPILGICRRLRQVVLFLSLFALSLSAFADGGVGSGGGTVVDHDGQPVLLDLLRVDLPAYQNFKDSHEIYFSPAQGTKKEVLKSSLFSLESFANQDEISATFSNEDLQLRSKQSGETIPADFLSSDPVQLAAKILQAWDSDTDSIVNVSFVKTGFVSPVQWEFWSDPLDGPLASLNDFPAESVSNPRLAAYYKRIFNPENKGQSPYSIQIDVNEWNQLGVLSQTGLVIHEVLRRTQFVLFGPEKIAMTFNDSALQIATSIMVLCKPRPILDRYLMYVLTGIAKTTETVPEYGSLNMVLQKYCKPTLVDGTYDLNMNWNHK